MDVIVIVNSVGEISSGLRPISHKIKERFPSSRIIVIIPPCQYAGGREKEVVRKMPNIDLVFSLKGYFKLLIFGKLDDFLPGKETVILHLGGDQAYTILLAKRLGVNALLYTNSRVRWKRYFQRIMVTDEKMVEDNSRYTVVGDLMVDSGALRSKGEVDGLNNRFNIGLFPGSRMYLIRYMIPFFLKVAEEISNRLKGVCFFISKSDFITEEEFEASIKKDKRCNFIEGCDGKITNGEIKTSKGLTLQIIRWIPKGLHLAITLPGTITGELASLGIPMIVICPMNKPELIPLDGVLGLMGYLPIIGKGIKRCAIKYMDRITRFVSIPNRKEGREIVQEVRGVITSYQVAYKAVELLLNEERRSRMSEELKGISGYKPASDNIVDVIEEVIYA
ncbi:MAG: hypothetical protein QME40_04900 [bacterium]|nr:hypothetical protein [bacterium]